MENEKKYIAVEDLKTALQNETADVIATYEYFEDSGFSRDKLNSIIDNTTKEEVAPVIHAMWKEDTFCSNCNYYDEDAQGHIVISSHKKFCSGCGAKMDLEVEI